MDKRLAPPVALRNAAIRGVGAYRPTRVVTNRELCRTLDTTEDWIVDRSGIVERRWAGLGESVISMATEAAREATRAAHLEMAQVDAVIVATVTHPAATPSAAGEVATRLGIPTAAAFDLSAACAGFCYGLSLARDMIIAGSSDTVLVVGSERLTDITNMLDRQTAFLFGDGAGAVVVQSSRAPGISPVVWGTDGTRSAAIQMSSSWADYLDDGFVKPTLTMSGREVFKWAVFEMVPVVERALTRAGITLDELDAFVPHQANLKITEALVRALHLPSHVRVARDVEKSGNTSSASIPMALNRMIDNGEIASGNLALLVGFGAGLVFGCQVVVVP